MIDAPPQIECPTSRVTEKRTPQEVHAEVVNTLAYGMDPFIYIAQTCKHDPLQAVQALPQLLKIRENMNNLIGVNNVEAGKYTGSGLTKAVGNLAKELPPEERYRLMNEVTNPTKAPVLRKALLGHLKQVVVNFFDNKLKQDLNPTPFPIVASSDSIESMLFIEEGYSLVVHDVGSALTPLPGAAYYLQKAPQKAKELAEASVGKLEEVLETSAKDLKREYPRQERTVEHLFRALQRGFRAILATNGITCVVKDLDDETKNAVVLWSEGYWGRLRSNQEQNYIRENGKITQVEVDAKIVEIDGLKFVEIIFRDNGPIGYPKKILDDQFEHKITIREDNSGTGEGMHGQQKAIKKYEGLLIAKNPPGGGAELTVRLPLQSSKT